MTEQLVALLQIKDNPYQGRKVYSNIEELGRSIAAEDLQENPKARATPPHSKGGNGEGKTYELKFGHRRLRAFLWLKDNFKALGLYPRYDGYTVIPLDIEELTDEEMNIGVIVENAQREDLTVIEEARMMRDYGTRWGRTSDQIGEKFSKSGATVRGVMRLLDLPEGLQDKVATGAISQGAARILLSAQKLISGDDMLRVVTSAQESPEDGTLEYQLDGEIERLDHVVSMWSDENGKKAQSKRYGNGWALDVKKFPNDFLPSLTYKDVVEGLRIKDTPHLNAIFEALIEAGKISYDDLQAKLIEINDPDAVRIGWLQKPGACNVCPYYAKIDGRHYCGMNVCHKRKETAWKRHLLEKAIKDLGIPIYQTSDGPFRLLDDDTEKGLWTKRNKDLRLMPQGADKLHGYQWLDGFDRDLGWVVLTGATLAKQKAAAKEKKTEVLEAAMSDGDRVANILSRADPVLAWEAARVVAQKFFEGWSQAQIDALKRATYAWRSFHTPPGMTFADEGCGSQIAVLIGRNILEGAENVMDTDSDDAYDLEDCKQAMEIAAHWGLVVSTLGCKLPNSVAKIAAEFDAQIASVAVETE